MEMTLCWILFWDKFYHCLDIIDIDVYLRVREFLRTSLCALIDQVQERRLQAPPTLISHFYMSMHMLIKVKLLATWSHISSTLKKEIVFSHMLIFLFEGGRQWGSWCWFRHSALGSASINTRSAVTSDSLTVEIYNKACFVMFFWGGGKCFRGHVSTLEIFE